ncbi:MAG: ATP-binding cassette domain-containing protein [Rickettsiaceae bacterium]|nr:ATP-binding cassette domain-containing protein [Rickettsiaceae bacterium]
MLELHNVTKSFPQNAQATLKDINLKVKEGEYCIILGSNGSGKSTLLKVISGEYPTDSGDITLNGKNVTKHPLHIRAKEIGSVAQDINKGTIDEMTLLENISLSKMRGYSAKYKFFTNQTDEIVKDIKLLGLDLEKHVNTRISSLSGGQRQSIASLMAMSPKPKLLLLDEHTSALDPRSKETIMKFTDNYIKNYNITTIMITHSIIEAINYGNRLIVMHHGVIAYDVSGSEKSKLNEQTILDILHKIGGPL